MNEYKLRLFIVFRAEWKRELEVSQERKDPKNEVNLSEDIHKRVI